LPKVVRTKEQMEKIVLDSLPSVNRKILIGAMSLAMVVSVTSCSKKNSASEPVPSASSSASESPTASASASPSVTKTEKPKPKPLVTHAAPAPVKPLAKKPYTQTVPPRPPIVLDKQEQAFEKQFTALTKLSPAAWDAKVDSDPLTYKLYYKEMLAYAKTALCSYIATGLDDFTLGSYITNEVTYDTDIQAALLSATRKAYGCKGA
jgi:hypothetical protein